VEGDVGRLDARDVVEGRPHLLKGVPRNSRSRATVLGPLAEDPS